MAKHTDIELIEMMASDDPKLHKDAISYMEDERYKGGKYIKDKNSKEVYLWGSVQYQVNKHWSYLTKMHVFDKQGDAVEHFWNQTLSDVFYRAKKGLELQKSSLKTYFNRVCRNNIWTFCKLSKQEIAQLEMEATEDDEITELSQKVLEKELISDMITHTTDEEKNENPDQKTQIVQDVLETEVITDIMNDVIPNVNHEAPDDSLSYKLLLEALKQCIRMLNITHRKLIELSILYGYTPLEIANKEYLKFEAGPHRKENGWSVRIYPIIPYTSSVITALKNRHLTPIRNCLKSKGYT